MPFIIAFVLAAVMTYKLGQAGFVKTIVNLAKGCAIIVVLVMIGLLFLVGLISALIN